MLVRRLEGFIRRDIFSLYRLCSTDELMEHAIRSFGWRSQGGPREHNCQQLKLCVAQAARREKLLRVRLYWAGSDVGAHGWLMFGV